jgi:hypothetical protein
MFYSINDLARIRNLEQKPLKLFAKRSQRPTLEKIINNICKSIGRTYIFELTTYLFKENQTKYDFIAISKQPIINDEDLMNNILGFMIVEKGECKKYPENFCVNLICAKNVGTILMELYLYIIINNNFITNKIGLLELGNSYYNVGGLCMYTKYGFEFDRFLSDETCFKYFPPNLPMIVKIYEKYGPTLQEQNEKLLTIHNRGNVFSKPDICNIRGDRQTLLGLALNLKLPQYISHNKPTEQMDRDLSHYNFGVYVKKFPMADGTTVDYHGLLNEINKRYVNIDNFINSFNNVTDEEVYMLLNQFVEKPPVINSASASASAPIIEEITARVLRSTNKKKRTAEEDLPEPPPPPQTRRQIKQKNTKRTLNDTYDTTSTVPSTSVTKRTKQTGGRSKNKNKSKRKRKSKKINKN